MYIHGHYYNKQNEKITVHIVTKGDRTEELVIGDGMSGLYFGEDPVETESQVNDTFDVLLENQATVRLLTANYMEDFFSSTCRDAVVNIYRDETCVFAGYIEPMALSQGYNEELDELELTCIDALCALQYSKYKNVGALGVDYSEVKSEAEQRSFLDIIKEILQGVTTDIDITGENGAKYWYDGSKAIDSQEDNRYKVLSQLSINELLFLGSEEDDVWEQDAVIEEMLKYLNLHIVQEGLDFYIFSWETIKTATDSITWHDITGEDTTQQTQCDTISITTDKVADCDASISVGEVYNQLQLTAKVESMENVIESPLDEDLLTSPYSNKQKYLTEYSSDGEGVTAYDAFYAMTHDEKTTYGAGSITDWYVQIMSNSQWKFPIKGDTTKDIVETYCSKGMYQHVVPDWLGVNAGACIMAMGSVKTSTANDDNSPVNKVNMTNYLVMSVNGNEKDSDSETYPQATDIMSHIPYAVYTGNTAGGAFSPSDDESTNYIVMSGKVILNPIMAQTNTYTSLHEREWSDKYNPEKEKLWVWHETVPSRTNGDGRYYTRKYWLAETPAKEETWHKRGDTGMYPYTGEGPEQYEFQYSAIGDGTDTISKVAVIACMLIIGDKCVVETGTDGQTTDFTWQTYKERSECQSDDEYYQQCFTIGFNPKIGDKLIGTEYDLQNNINYRMGVDAEGTAIPIKKSDKVSGQVQFMILGPVNTTWDEVTRRHPTWFRHTKWTSTSVPLLAHVSSIMLKSFEVKVYSDNGLVDNGDDDNDIVYMSDTKETYVNVKDDLEMKIHSALTTAECKQLGVNNSVKISTPVCVDTGEGVLNIYDHNRGDTAKAEQIYVDRYYTEYHLPRIILQQCMMDTTDGGVVSIWNHYRLGTIDKTFYVQGISRNLTDGTADMTLKEIDA